jgi:ElaB/YqjD/DUF883 family membrane-anchored ribosome-binding protein
MGIKGSKDVSAAYLSDAAAQGQRLAQDIDGRLQEYTGKSSEAWLKDATRMMTKHPWKAVAVVGLVAYVLGKVRG